jgi:peroxiredoxin (alkyl hydroperoxide reductase subunit C)
MSKEKSPGMPLLGDPFPKMTVNTTHGVLNLPEDATENGKYWVCLFSHPADFTPVCTTEFHAFAKRNEKFQELNTRLIGLSIDQVFSHIKWGEWIEENLDTKIPFPIIEGTEDVANKLGMVHPGQGSSTVRAVFIIDPEGKTRLILYYPKEIGRNMDEIIRVIKALQTADKNKVAIPANWPDNELFGDEVIVPPAKTVKDAEERLANKDKYTRCLDWWLCTKKL